MTRSRRRFVAASSLFTVALACTLVAQAQSQQLTSRITAAANVSLRNTPASDAAVVTQLPLGTEVTDAGPAGLDKRWIRVKLADNREGWLQSSLTRQLDPLWRWPVFDRIISERLGRNGDGFAASVELVNFIERVAPEYTDTDGRGRIELARLRALSRALSAVPMGGGRREPYAAWLTSRKNEVVYDEPGGHWILSDAPLWESHLRQIKTTSADEIAWLAVTNGLPGECGGGISCYLTSRNRLHGEYLRRHPFGLHAPEAVSIVKGTTDLLTAPQKTGTAYRFDKKTDCKDLSASTDALTAAVQGTRADGRDAVLAGLVTIRKMCQ